MHLREARAATAISMRDRIAARIFASGDPPTETIAGFQLLRQIGSGAAGDVYVARDPELDRTIAIKVLRPAGDEDAELRRLHREARTLARLAHPNVVHVYEVGKHELRLYIAMEYVAGSSLLEWQRHTRHTWKEILHCYVEVARGLAAAHAVGIVHRDIKPANVLVGEDARVCVADFGLARPVDERTDRAEEAAPRDTSVPTSTTPPTDSRHAPAGTPAYMAPETITLRVADPLSDQFSWAVALYEALYSRRPWVPADYLDPRGEDRLVVARRRPSGEVVPSWLRRALRRALSWDPQARWSSLQLLLDALVIAPQRRARVTRVAVGSIAIVATGGVTWWFSWERQQCPDQAHQLAGIWDDPTKTRSKNAFIGTGLAYAEETWAFTGEQLDRYVDTWLEVHAEACAATRIRGERSDELFDRSFACLEARRTQLAAVSERMQVADAAVVEHADGLLATLPPVASCLDRELVRTNPAFLPSAGETAGIRKVVAAALAASATGDAPTAVALAEQAVEQARDVGDRPLLAEALWARARMHRAAGQVAPTVRDLEEAIDESEAGHHDEVRPLMLLELARVDAELVEDSLVARSHVRRARAALLRIGGDPERHPAWLEASALAEARDGQLGRAEPLIRRALELRENDEQARPTETATTLVLLANLLADTGRVDEAALTYDRARAIRVQTVGATHPLVAAVDFNRGQLALATGDLDRAARSLSEAREVYASAYGGDAPILATVHAALAEYALAVDAPQQAIMDATRALAIQRAMEQPERSVLSSAHRALANAYAQLGDRAHARDENLAVLELDTGVVPEIELAPIHINVGYYLCKLDACAGAEAHFKGVITSFAGEESPMAQLLVAYAHKGLGKVALSEGLPEEALDYLQTARGLLPPEAIVGDAVLRGEFEWAFARANEGLGRPDAARQHARAAREAFAAAGTASQPELAEVEAWLHDGPPSPR